MTTESANSDASRANSQRASLPLFVLLYTMMFLFALVYAAAALSRVHYPPDLRGDPTMGILLGAFLAICVMFALVGALSWNWRPSTPEVTVLIGGSLGLIIIGRILGTHWLMVVPAGVALLGYLIYLCWRLDEIGLRLLTHVTLAASVLVGAVGVWNSWGLWSDQAHAQIWPRPWPYPDQAVELLHKSLVKAHLLERPKTRFGHGQLLITDCLTCGSLGLVALTSGAILARGRAPLQFSLRTLLGFMGLVAWLLANFRGAGAMAAGYLALSFLVAKTWSLVRWSYAETLGGAASGALVAFACTAFLTPVPLPAIKCALWGGLVGGVTGFAAVYPWGRWLRQAVALARRNLTAGDSAPPSPR